MAQAVEDLTPIRDLDDLLEYLTKNLRCTKVVAVRVMNEAYLAGHLRLTKVEYVGVKPQGEVPINFEFGHIELDPYGRPRFVPRTKLWRKAIYRIAEGCDVRAIWSRCPPASQTAPVQRPEDSAGPDPSVNGHIGFSGDRGIGGHIAFWPKAAVAAIRPTRTLSRDKLPSMSCLRLPKQYLHESLR
jgi:hypothetical protein